MGEDEKTVWDKDFVKVDDETLFSLILAANYLDIKPLLDLTRKTVADYIKQCKTPQEIRRRFNIKNDFTPEEEEEVRKENAWCRSDKRSDWRMSTLCRTLSHYQDLEVLSFKDAGTLGINN